MATFRDLKTFVEREGWVEEPNLTHGRARTGDHWRYRKNLMDGTSLRTKVSHGLHDDIGIDLFKHILRDQLQVTEEHFWDVVRGRAALVVDVPPPPADTVPGWLVQQLLLTVGLPEDAVRAMTRAEAHAAWDDYRTRPK